MGVVVVASGSSPSGYIRGLIRRIDRGDPNATERSKMYRDEPGFSMYNSTGGHLDGCRRPS